MEFLIAGVVLLVLGYTAWVFRWYWVTLLSSLRTGVPETPDPETEREPIGLRRHR